MEHKYNYVIFNTRDAGLPTYNDEGYYSICLKDLWGSDYVQINSAAFDYLGSILGKIARRILLMADKHVPVLRNLLYSKYMRLKYNNEKPLCFVCFRYTELSYLKYLKKRYPNAIFVKFVRDIISTQQTYYNNYKSADIFDYWITYDEGEAQHYGMKYFNEIESKVNLPKEAYDIKYDVFFAGRAKKRLPKLIKVYDKLVSQGVKPFFYITNAQPEEQIKREGIVYTDELLSYKQMLIYSCQSKFMLEINQEGAVGFTSRYIEAILYNKRLITDNTALVNAPYYNPENIQCFSSIDDIDAKVMMLDTPVDYNYQGTFSPIHLIDFIENLINSKK